ncbi:MAG: DinB family protein [Bacteroidia bacterium]|nr:DinB family protein [Bacteroidia bacterium]
MKEKLLKLIAYSLWANRLMFQLLLDEKTTDEKMIFWAGHILNAEEIWMDRIEGKEVKVSPMEMRSLNSIMPDLERLNSRFQQLVDSREETDLYSIIHYQDSKGNPYENVLSDILFHMVNHETHHRSQIAARLREQGIAPPKTDYIFFVR